ncbi:MAG: glycosyltransferase [Gemmatimonadetes bacterium]|nr:glycosyltransferase [Gemmatimonadota bacterium]
MTHAATAGAPIAARDDLWLDRWAPEVAAGPRLLVVTHYFPPIPEAGSARWEGLVRWLAPLGLPADVVLLHPSTYDAPDWGRLDTLPATTRLAGIPIPPPPAWFRLLSGAKRRLKGPPKGAEQLATKVTSGGNGDARPVDLTTRLGLAARADRMRRWSAAAVEFAVAHAAPGTLAVVSSSPPHFIHRAAHRISHRLGCPHVMDLRDPWPADELDVNGRVVDAAERRRIISGASLILANTESATARVREEFPALTNRLMTLMNAVDLPPQPREAGAAFTIAHCGTLYLDRDPRPLLRAVRRVVDAAQPAHPIRLELMGPPAMVEGAPLEALIADLGLAPHTVHHGQRPRDAVFGLLRRSAVAVALQGKGHPTQIPAKVFDYMAFPLRILALVGEASATADLLRGTSALVHDLDDEDAIAAALTRAYAEHVRGEAPDPIAVDPRFSRRAQAERLHRHLLALGSR